MSAQTEWQVRKYGGRLVRKTSRPTATDTPTVGVKADPERVTLTIVNDTASVLTLGFGEPVSAGSGTRLSSSGGVLTMTLEDDPDLIGEPIYFAIPSGSVTPLVVSSRRYNAAEDGKDG